MLMTLADKNAFKRLLKKKPSKHRNVKCVDADGNKFDSRLERRRWDQLRILQAGGAIYNLRRQVRFPLYTGRTKLLHDGFQFIGRPVQIAVYVADFTYTIAGVGGGARYVVEDVKGQRPGCTKNGKRRGGGPAWAQFRLKAKFFAANYGMEITLWPEVTK